MRGKVFPEIRAVFAYLDHPRLCGEKVENTIDHSTAVGITPAYAGKRR